MTTTQHARIDLPGRVALDVVLRGDAAGLPVVFLHGGTDSWRSFEPVLPHLPHSIRAIAVSQRGHGDSGRPSSGYGPPDFAGDVAALLDQLGIDRAVIAGHSMGSHVAQRFALDHPDRTAGLVLAGAFRTFATNAVITEYWDTVVSTLDDPIDRSVAVEFQESTLARPVPDAFLEMVVGESLEVPARVWRDLFAGLLKIDHADRLGSIAVPTLILWGDRDAFCPRTDQDALLAAIPAARLTVYAGAGHALHWEEPERYAADVATYVASL
ncbi:MAG: alpha/beta fold hydrolase [Acidimicrobiia bacterium]